MALNIRKADEPVKIGSLITLLYGQPGVGKTSVSCSAGNALVLDFDKGVHRSAFRKDAVPVEKWADVASIEAADLKGYDTLVVDTVGKALDALGDSIMAADPKKGRGGQLTMQGFGALKGQFVAWLKRITRMGVDVILIAHVKEERNGDNILLRPDMTGGSYQFALQCADLVGYQHAGQSGSVIEFTPSSDWVGKDCAQLGAVQVPHLADSPVFMAELLAGVKRHLEGMSDAQAAAMEDVHQWHERAQAASDADTVNELVVEVQLLPDGMVKEQAKKIVTRRAKELSLTFSEGQFHAAA